ncbi:MAG: hypothetical protein JW748_11125 [Anaerolineales bacterium]|nr:hypothetical protein [Anaerolineales bacterium]
MPRNPGTPSWIRPLILVLLLSAIGCTGGKADPARTAGAQTPSLPIDTQPATEAVETAAALSSLSPDLPFVRIKSAALGTYLYEADQQVKLGPSESFDIWSQWVLEDFQGSKRIRNRGSSNYMSIEHLRPYVEMIPIEDVWMSPRWTVKNDPADGSVILQNVWHNWEVLYTDSAGDTVKYGRAPDPKTAKWILEDAGGGSLPTSTATPMIGLPTPSVPAGTRGALVPWIEYEAEDGITNGEILGPDRTFGTIASESSGRRAVRLDATGEYVQFKSSQVANSIVVRYVIPDTPTGIGMSASLSLYVNGVFRRKLELTSHFAWSYGGEEYSYNTPSVGGAHHFYDEARALTGEIPANAAVRLQKDEGDSAEYYVIDLADLELVGPALEMPPGSLSITDCGAAPDDGADDGPAIQQCVDQARTQKKSVWIPAGTFESTSVPINVDEVAIRGAGMWHSNLHGFYARFNCVGNNCRYSDFAILGETVTRVDSSPENGFNGGGGTGSSLENIWVEHTKVGYWVGPGTTNGLVILGSRFRNLFADGVNFCNGTSNSVVENSHFRYTGDDALASWSPLSSEGVNTNNVFRYNTVQIPWRANCFALYGGADNKIEDNLCLDVVTYPGILVAQDFQSHPFSGSTGIQRNSLVRAGGPMFRQEHGALKIQAKQGAIAGVLFKDIHIDSATYSGIEIQGTYEIRGIIFENIQIDGPGTWGIFIRSDVAGEVSFTNVIVTDPDKEGLLNNAPRLDFSITKGVGNSGW